MTERQRLSKVLDRQKPDKVPWFADLGHWYRAESGEKWDIFSIDNTGKGMIDLHAEVKAGWYIEVGSLHEEYFEDDVIREKGVSGDIAIERYKTRLGEVSMERKWNPKSFSWDITKRMIQNIDDLKILTHVIGRKRFRPKLGNWDKIEALDRNWGFGFPSIGYTGFGSLISLYMGVSDTIYAVFDEPDIISEYINTHNQKQLELLDIYCDSKAPHLFFSDNLSGDVQSPDMFMKYSFEQYKNIADKIHKANKTVSAHIDGKIHGLIGIMAKAGIDVADACTPAPTGDLTPAGIRHEAGDDMILFGGVSPDKWLPTTSEKDFIEHVRQWLDLKNVNSNFVQTAGDQVPPGTKLQRIKLMAEIVQEYGQY